MQCVELNRQKQVNICRRIRIHWSQNMNSLVVATHMIQYVDDSIRHCSWFTLLRIESRFRILDNGAMENYSGCMLNLFPLSLNLSSIDFRMYVRWYWLDNLSTFRSSDFNGSFSNWYFFSATHSLDPELKYDMTCKSYFNDATRYKDTILFLALEILEQWHVGIINVS